MTLREIAQNELATAARARPGRRGGDGQRRPAAPDSHRAVEGKDHRAQPLGRPRRPDAAAGEPEHAARRGDAGRRDLPGPQPGRVHQPRRHPQPRRHDARRRADLPARHRRGHRLHRGPPAVHAHRRPAGRPDGGQQAVGENTVAVSAGHPGRSRAHQPRGARHPHAGDQRPVDLHRARDRQRAGARAARRHPRRADHLRVPARLPLDADRLARRFRSR